MPDFHSQEPYLHVPLIPHSLPDSPWSGQPAPGSDFRRLNRIGSSDSEPFDGFSRTNSGHSGQYEQYGNALLPLMYNEHEPGQQANLMTSKDLPPQALPPAQCNETPYKTDPAKENGPFCTKCKKKFTRMGSLRRHKLIHQEPESCCLCPHCSAKIKRQDNLNRHIQEAHRCEICISNKHDSTSYFMSGKERRKHMKDWHRSNHGKVRGHRTT